MTEMKRVTVSIPDEMDERIANLRKKDEFLRDSYSEIVRKLLERGLAILAEEQTA